MASSRSARPMNVVLGVLFAGLAAVAALRWSDFGQIAVVTGVLLVLLMPVRKDPRAFWSLLAGLLVLVAAYVVSAPANCTTGAYARAGGDQTPGRFCESVIGIDYEREGTQDPSPLPAFAGSLAAGLIVAGVVRLAFRRSEPEHERQVELDDDVEPGAEPGYGDPERAPE